MKIKLLVAMLMVVSLTFGSCGDDKETEKPDIENPDPDDNDDSPLIKRNQATETFYANLKKFATQKIMFGMANPTTLGYKNGPKNNNINQSDCKDITGSHPAFYESDFMWYTDKKFKEWDIDAMKQAHQRGAVIGYCWHMRGRESDDFYAKKDGAFTQDRYLVNAILAGGTRKTNPALNWYFTQLDEIVIPVFKELGFPILFRPFHEMNGGWFWWGSHSDAYPADRYKKLYQLTVDYLRKNEVTNILYVWSPDSDAAFDFYPGDDYVDVLGLDIYEPGIASWNPTSKYLNSMKALTEHAEKHDKLVAVTETGLRKDNNTFRYPEVYPDFWTKYVLQPLIENSNINRIAYIMSWYNADWNNDDKGTFYIPYSGVEQKHTKGADAVLDFRSFYNNINTAFEDDLPDLYK